ncbi:MAG: hypothetical protein A3J37_02310 [Alphaproteobacteria bacterium RIFCSPHIGHO2_12_FULL_45_9]|nr:MAG: hypothetical protein A3B66_10580 [Alphaproteobacteria bacterium RIFCSPHIGHO2_02_FULL_46_13]OFW99485.1 MAG: hypothetical protein A3J37_02310 [Alphaproteobacteria bacterium RIFCSPHIGHO2_12_FULL_45_9]
MSLTGNRTLKVAQYMLLPQILPRFASLIFGGFSYLAYFVAQVYRGVRLLPEGHPYLNPSEIGHYSIPDVVRAAGVRLKYSRDTIDQVIIFYVILLGMVLIAFQTLMLIIGVFAPQAMALSLTAYFGNPHLTTGVDPYQDLAFILLDRVFGVPGIFDSCVSMATPCYMAAPDNTWSTADTVYTPATFPWPFHNALHAMFSFYSTGLLVIGLMILLYLVVVIIAETAQTGVPFGKRFNKVWAPIRLVAALGLLIPVSYGLNSAQYIVLYAAKLGSNFATNGWFVFNAALTNSRMTTDTMIALPKTPNVGPLLQFMMLAHACKAVEEGYKVQQDRPEGWQLQAPATCGVDAGDQINDSVIQAYIVKFTGDSSNDAVPLENQSYADARTFSGNGDITITFGDRGCEKTHNQNAGHAVPTCGQLVLTTPSQETDTAAGAYVIQEGYYNLVKYMWGEYQDPPGSGINEYVKIWSKWAFCNKNIGGEIVQSYQSRKYDAMMTGMQGDLELREVAISPVQELCPPKVDTYDFDETLPNRITSAYLNGAYGNYMFGQNDAVAPNLVTASAAYSPGGTADAVMTNIIRKGVNAENALVNSGKYNIPIDLMDRGWGGAGLWYNSIASANGAITGAAQATPKITHYPAVMETVMAAKLRNNKNVTADDLFTPTKGEDSDLQLQNVGDAKGVIPLQRIYAAWKDVANEGKPATGNMIYDVLNYIFGTQGLFDLRDPGNKDVHPLALMTSMGKSLLEASIRNLGISAALNVGGGMMGGNANVMGVGVEVASNFLFMIVGATLGAGIILYYVLPFMPFIYFFFALGSWVKEVFEAMVGVPLWALAHLRIDGDGLPGEAARSGYFMIFEIFLRPIMIVFGLIAAVSIFASMATVLNSIFDIAVINAGGTNFANSGTVTFSEYARGPIDQLFYTILYAVLMYIIAMSSFKMIDLIPNQIMRWLGVSVSAFAGQTGDSAGQLMNTMQQQGLAKVDGVVGGINSGTKGLGKIAEGMTNSGK